MEWRDHRTKLMWHQRASFFLRAKPPHISDGAGAPTHPGTSPRHAAARWHARRSHATAPKHDTPSQPPDSTHPSPVSSLSRVSCLVSPHQPGPHARAHAANKVRLMPSACRIYVWPLRFRIFVLNLHVSSKSDGPFVRVWRLRLPHPPLLVLPLLEVLTVGGGRGAPRPPPTGEAPWSWRGSGLCLGKHVACAVVSCARCGRERSTKYTVHAVSPPEL